MQVQFHYLLMIQSKIVNISTTYIFGSMNFKTFLKNYINIDIKKFFYKVQENYVKKFYLKKKILLQIF